MKRFGLSFGILMMDIDHLDLHLFVTMIIVGLMVKVTGLNVSLVGIATPKRIRN